MEKHNKYIKQGVFKTCTECFRFIHLSYFKRDQILSELESSVSISVLRADGPLSNLVPQSAQK